MLADWRTAPVGEPLRAMLGYLEAVTLRRGLADYFAPSNVLARANSGSGQPFSGRTLNADGDLVSDNGAVRVERGPVPPRPARAQSRRQAAPASH